MSIEFSRNGELLAVVSDSNPEIKIFLCRKGKQIMSLMLPSKKEVVKKLNFDEFTKLLMVLTENRSMHIYQLPIVRRNMSEKTMKGRKCVATFSLPKNRLFWAFFGAKLFEINVVSEDFAIYRLKYDSASKALTKGDMETWKIRG
jgi:hypothetical protein